MKKIFSNNSILSLSGNATTALLGFLSFALLARALSREDFGNWVIFLTIYIFIELVRVGFLQTPVVKFSSGVDEKTKSEVYGAAWGFAIIFSVSLAVICYLIFMVIGHMISNSGAALFFKWFGLLFLISLPFNFATWIQQAEMKFNRILYIRFINLGTFVVLNIYSFLNGATTEFVLYSYMFASILASMVSLMAGWTSVKSLKYFSWNKLKAIFHFGKYSTGTMMGANLLRSSDTFIIGAMLGPEAVAMYSVPLKLFEIVEIPLRSFVATTLPVFSRMINENNRIQMKYFLEKVTGMCSLGVLPVVLFSFIFADPLVVLLGGEEYRASANILRIFALLSAFMPIDRYSGVALDVLNMPQINFVKVLLMLLVNIGGDLLVLWVFGNLISVAAVSILTFVSGVVMGMYFLNSYMPVSFKNMMLSGVNGIKELLLKVMKMKFSV
ncbi:MAG: oligosaccharide flippase family protein [Cytophagaceae bacterium]